MEGKDPPAAGLPSAIKPCPHCGESIQAAAKKCRHCGEWLDLSRRREQPAGSQAHIVLKVWGILLMVLYAGMGALQLLNLVMMAVMLGSMGRGGGPGGGFLLPMLIGSLIPLLVCVIFVRMGWGLYQGMRSAVIGVSVLTGLALLGVAAILVLGGFKGESLVVAGILLALTAALSGPPIAVGFANWAALK